MFPLSFHYEDVSRQDPLLKLNHANVMEVPGSCEIRVVPTPSDFRIQNGKLAMEIPHGQRFIQREPQHQVSKSNPFEKDGGSVNSPVKIKENSIQFSMETEFCEFSPELEDHFEIFEHIRGFNVTIVTSANTQDETLSSWSGFFQQDGAQEDYEKRKRRIGWKGKR
ncbi:hypothetical protein MKW98_000172 [Papaver atlanticum]|uniref:Ribosomal protein L5 n=1 Tax=Papaver atlanticum TaxID=357466 RepID=A0AAD4SQB8_9MAGN|nr:hypothetical protein MKW98_000172 [Papaver atlanticum]